MRSKLSMLLVLAGLAVLTGCPVAAPPPEESVLQGTWELTGDLVADEVSDFLITFDENGRITRLTYNFAGISVVISDVDSISSSSDVNGSNVTISANWLQVNTLTFQGVLNSSQDRADGSTTFSVVVGGITATVPTGDASLIKQ